MKASIDLGHQNFAVIVTNVKLTTVHSEGEKTATIALTAFDDDAHEVVLTIRLKDDDIKKLVEASEKSPSGDIDVSLVSGTLTEKDGLPIEPPNPHHD